MKRLSRQVIWAAVVGAVLLVTTGCGDMFDNPYQKTGPAETAKAAEQLTKLSTLEDTEKQLKSAVEELGGYASTLVPGLTWQWVDSRSQDSCERPFDQTQGRQVFMQNYVASSGIPDAVWSQVLDRARQLAATLGATETQTYADEPGHRNVGFYSPEGTEFMVGSRGALIGSKTGCRLPAAVKNAPPLPSSSSPTSAPR